MIAFKGLVEWFGVHTQSDIFFKGTTVADIQEFGTFTGVMMLRPSKGSISSFSFSLMAIGTFLVGS